MPKRLANYDYRQPGFYYVTICIKQHRLVFGTIRDGQIFLKEPGQVAQTVLLTLPKRFSHVKLDEYVFMPNHMHVIIELTDQGLEEAKPVQLYGRSFEYLRLLPLTRFVVWKVSRGSHGKRIIMILLFVRKLLYKRFVTIFSIIHSVGSRTNCTSDIDWCWNL